MEPRIIIVGGLQGTGKTTIANELAKEIGVSVYSKDVLEAAIVRSGLAQPDNLKGTGFELLKTLALSNYDLSHTSILDCVAPAHRVSLYWPELMDFPIKYIECICSDEQLHKTRIEKRTRNIEGWYELTWDDVLQTKEHYRPFKESRLVLDSVESLNANIQKALTYVRTECM